MNNATRIRLVRSGASLVETAFVLMTLFIFLFGMLEFGMAALRQNMLDEAAHRLARAASIRGEDSHLEMWGPTAIETSLDQTPELLAAIGPASYLLDPQDIRVAMNWQDEMAKTNSLVSVNLQCQQGLLLGNLWGMSSVMLASKAVERIE